MTTDTTPTTAPTLAPDDPRPAFAAAIALAGTVVAGVRDDQLDDPTPCTEYDVRRLRGHLLCVARRMAAVGRGEDPATVPQVIADVPGDDWPAAWTEAAHEIQRVWSDDSLLGRDVVLPFATLPGAVALRIYTGETTVHTWDLATATGQSPAWDDAIVAGALATHRVALPADHRGPEVPFDPPVPVADDAPLIDQLVAWNGRRP